MDGRAGGAVDYLNSPLCRFVSDPPAAPEGAMAWALVAQLAIVALATVDLSERSRGVVWGVRGLGLLLVAAGIAALEQVAHDGVPPGMWWSWSWGWFEVREQLAMWTHAQLPLEVRVALGDASVWLPRLHAFEALVVLPVLAAAVATRWRDAWPTWTPSATLAVLAVVDVAAWVYLTGLMAEDPGLWPTWEELGCTLHV